IAQLKCWSISHVPSSCLEEEKPLPVNLKTGSQWNPTVGNCQGSLGLNFLLVEQRQMSGDIYQSQCRMHKNALIARSLLECQEDVVLVRFGGKVWTVFSSRKQ